MALEHNGNDVMAEIERTAQERSRYHDNAEAQPMMITLLGKVGTGGTVGHIAKSDKDGWWVRLTPPNCDQDRLKDRDDQRAVVWANSYDTPGKFLDAMMRAGFAPTPRITRISPASDYHDWTKDDHRFEDARYPWHHYPEVDADDDYIELIGDHFEIIDTRRVIQERVPWANVVVQPSTFGYEHYQFYAHVEYF